MKTNLYGEMIYSDEDLCNFVMQGHSLLEYNNLQVDETVDIETAIQLLEEVPAFIRHSALSNIETVQEYDHRNQQCWHMPQQYADMDIAEHVLGKCKTDAELQRVGQELLLFQERDLFNLLKYLVYLVDIMKHNLVIWGVGRGSSVASYILYLLGVHRINSLHYNLNPTEFLR
jgi:DNA polymerase III alpha subunit